MVAELAEAPGAPTASAAMTTAKRLLRNMSSLLLPDARGRHPVMVDRVRSAPV
jgi:hypothetical protein